MILATNLPYTYVALQVARQFKNSILPNQRGKLVLGKIFFYSSGGMINLPSICVLRDKKNM